MNDQNGRWVTINGAHVFLKDGQSPMDAFIRQQSNKSENITAVHYTNKDNVKSIEENGFNLNQVGSGAGTTFGNGIYFTTGENEKLFYQNRITNSQEITADINTQGFLQIEYDGLVSRKTKSKDPYNQLSLSLKPQEQKLYKQRVKQLQAQNKIALEKGDYNNYSYDVNKDAIMPIVENNYAGLIVKQKNTNGIDVITGGNQIVVYDLSRIKVRK